jgi:hypothetical protein
VISRAALAQILMGKNEEQCDIEMRKTLYSIMSVEIDTFEEGVHLVEFRRLCKSMQNDGIVPMTTCHDHIH